MIRVENPVKRFGTLTAVDHISFEVGEGEMFAFLGPNGAGKTTTIKMLTTLLQPDGGTLEVDGRTPANAPTRYANASGLCFRIPAWMET